MKRSVISDISKFDSLAIVAICAAGAACASAPPLTQPTPIVRAVEAPAPPVDSRKLSAATQEEEEAVQADGPRTDDLRFTLVRSDFSVMSDAPQARLLDLGGRLLFVSDRAGGGGPFTAFAWEGSALHDVSAEINGHFSAASAFRSGIAVGETEYVAVAESTESSIWVTTIHRRDKAGWKSLGELSGFPVSTTLGFARSDAGCLYTLYIDQNRWSGGSFTDAKFVTLEGGAKCPIFSLNGPYRSDYDSNLLLFPHAFVLKADGTPIIVGSDGTDWASLTFDAKGKPTVTKIGGRLDPSMIQDGDFVTSAPGSAWVAGGGWGGNSLLAIYAANAWHVQQPPVAFEIAALGATPKLLDFWVVFSTRARNVHGYPSGQLWHRRNNGEWLQARLGLEDREPNLDVLDVLVRGEDDIWVLAENDGSGRLFHSLPRAKP